MGNGLGESACVHLGGQKWLIVDSMIDRPGDPPAALAYLDAFEYEDGLAAHVVGMVVTHWHDDHTRGFHQLNVALPDVPLWIPAALDPYQFLTRVRAVIETDNGTAGSDDATAAKPRPDGPVDDTPEQDGEAPAGLQGLYALLSRERKGHGPLSLPDLGHASSGKHIAGWTSSPGLPECRVTALSPSDAATDDMRLRFSEWLAKRLAVGEPSGLPHVEQNHLSVALHVQVGNVHVLLGSDLERRPGRMGWEGVVKDLTRDFHPVSLFKIAHHGSRTAHDERLIPAPTKLLTDRTHGMLTPFRQGISAVPSADETATLASGLTSVWTTSPDPRYEKTPDSVRVLNALTARGFAPKTKTRDFGMLRARLAVDPGPGQDWDIQPFGAAARLSPGSRAATHGG